MKEIKQEHIKDIEFFPWYKDVFIDNTTITYKNINFSEEIILFSENHIKYNNKLFQYNDKLPNLSKNTPIKNKNICFENCTFSKLTVESISEGMEKVDIIGGKIIELNIIDATINSKFYINRQNKKETTIDTLKIKNSIFQKNFKLHNTRVNSISIEDTDFEKHADFFMSKFMIGTLAENKEENISENDIGFKNINFRGFALFGDTEFHKKVIFKFATFESFSHIRKSKIYKGLDLDDSNIKDEMNFFDVKELDKPKAQKNTSQETFRIIKFNFQKIGNTIEANKYHAFELSKRKDNVCSNYKVLDCLTSFFHKYSSVYSTNWLLALMWIIVVGVLTTLFLDKDVCDINNIAHYMTIFNRFNSFEVDKSINYIVFIFNKILLGYLYYQFLTAIRKDTRK